MDAGAAFAFAQIQESILYKYSGYIHTPLVPIHKIVSGELISVRIHAPHAFTPGQIQANKNLAACLCIGFVAGAVFGKTAPSMGRETTNEHKEIWRDNSTDMSRLSRGNVTFVPRTVCSICVELHTNQVGKSRMSQNLPSIYRPRDTAKAYQPPKSFMCSLFIGSSSPFSSTTM